MRFEGTGNDVRGLDLGVAVMNGHEVMPFERLAFMARRQQR